MEKKKSVKKSNTKSTSKHSSRSPKRKEKRTDTPKKKKTHTSGQGKKTTQSRKSTNRDQKIKNKQEKVIPKKEKVPSTTQKIIKMGLQTIMYVFMISIIVIAIVFSLSGEKNRDILGYRFYTVLTNSMVPDKKNPKKNSFHAQDIVFTKKVSYDELKKDDVVSFTIGDGNAVLTHRLVKKIDHVGKIKGDYMVTKGDANQSQDPPIPADKLLGKVVFVLPKVGLVITFVRENIWLCILFAVSLFGSIYVLKNYYL